VPVQTARPPAREERRTGMLGSARFAAAVLAWNVLVVLAGALVRSTGSGAGCGRSWPSCQGSVLPELTGATAIEYGHRAVSGVALVLVALLVVGVFRSKPAGHPARRGAILSAVAIVVESLIGALIVFSEWVADDASVARVISVPLHLVNTLFLLAVLTLTVYWLAGGRTPERSGRPAAVVWIGLGMVLIAATGAVTALADTLFPKEGFTVLGVFDLETSEHFLTRLRVAHPIVSVVVGLVAAWWAATRVEPDRVSARAAARVVVAVVAAQFVLGFLNVAFSTPTWLALLHLLAADVLWIAWVWMSASLGEAQPRVEAGL
jgi:heme a synthase